MDINPNHLDELAEDELFQPRDQGCKMGLLISTT